MKKTLAPVQPSVYEPTPIHNTRNSSFWRWRRVAEWERYINDPLEKTNGHMII